MRSTTRVRLAAAAVAVGMLTAACGGNGNEESGSGSGGDGSNDLRVYSSEPAFLVPTAANDEPSILVIQEMFRGLVKYNAETGEPENDLAASIESEDNQTWTIEIKEGYTFTNGEPVDADAFLRSWNYTGNINNAQNNSYFMSRIQGFEEMQAEGAPEDLTFSGLEKVDDYTFEVTLNEPFVGFPSILGYSGFFPVAQECLDDFDACNEQPITNGPYKMDGSWQHNEQIRLTKWDGWNGETQGKVDAITYRIFDSIQAGYAAYEGGELDMMYTIPPEEFGQVEQQYGDRLLTAPGNSFTFVGFPTYQQPYDNKKLRQAMSLAIDRPAIIEAIFSGSFTPAQGFVSPNFEGYREGICEYCEHDPERAKQLFQESGVSFDGPVTLWANGGAGHEEWLQAVGNQLQETLGIEYEIDTSISQFPAYLDKADGENFGGPFRLGWGPDYPIMETYLTPLYGTNGSSNNFGYSNQEFAQLIVQGDRASSLDEARDSYQQAEDIVAEDMPVIPMWFGKEFVVWSENVSEVQFKQVDGVPDYGQTQMN